MNCFSHVDYFNVDAVSMLVSSNSEQTLSCFLPPSLVTGVNLGMVSVGYESFLVNPSLLCLHQFCVVMSEYLTVFHLNIV